MNIKTNKRHDIPEKHFKKAYFKLEKTFLDFFLFCPLHVPLFFQFFKTGKAVDILKMSGEHMLPYFSEWL
jgi:hypothetical protein